MSAARIGKVRFKEFTVSAEALAGFSNRPKEPAFFTSKDVFKVATPPPGVVPDNVKLASDDVSGMYDYAAGLGFNGGVGFAGLPYLAQLTQRPEYRRPSETLAATMTRKWIKFGTNDGGDKSDKIKQIVQAIDDYKVKDVLRSSVEYDGFYGRGHIYIDTGETDDDVELNTPLALHAGKIKKDGLVGLTAIDPNWTYPTAYNAIDPLHADFYKPKSWYVMKRPVHRTRLLTLISREVPDLLKPMYAFGGISLSQLSKPYVDNWLRTRQSVSDLVHSFSTLILETQMAQVLNGGAASALQNRLALYNMIRDNRGILAIQKDQEQLSNVTTPLTTLDQLQAQSQEQMASVTGIPITILLGITPSGLNASSDGEIRNFYDWCAALQERVLRAPLTRIIDVIQMSLFGAVDADITFSFEPLWQLDEAGLAGVQKTKADTGAVLLEANVITPDEERQRIANDEFSAYHGLKGKAPPPPEPADPSQEEDPSLTSEQTVTNAGERGKETGEESGV